MRHLRLFAIIILLLLPCALFAVEEYPFSPFMVLGHVDSSLSLTVNIDDSILPIDFSSDSVKYNPTPDANAEGLKIGTYSIISNVNFNLYIAHTPFNLRTPTEALNENKSTSIDYVLYVISDMSDGEFKYCFGSESAANPALITEEHKSIMISKAVNNGLARIVNHPMFLSLDDEDKINSTRLLAGLYESTVYFVLESE